MWGDSVDTICCHSPDEKAIWQVKRPARTTISCLSIPSTPPGPGCPCCGPVKIQNTYGLRDDHVVVYGSGECDWLWIFDVTIPEACDACDSCSGDSYACGTAHSLFGAPMLDCPSCEYTRWTERQSTITAADPATRWWNDIQCYNDGGYISAADYGYAPTVAGDPCTRGSNPGGTYILADYYLGTFHRRITWQRECWSDTFDEEGPLSAYCATPAEVAFVAAGAPLFEMDLYAAADTDLWGAAALSLTVVQRFICAVRNGVSPTQADIEAVFNHPAGMLGTRDWRSRQTADDAYLATVYPTEYGPCTPQTALLGPVVKRCWPAIKPEEVVSAVTGIQATCLPTPTPAMEADPEWIIRRPTYFRPRPGYWGWTMADPPCSNEPFASAGLPDFSGAPFGSPTCSYTAPDCSGPYPTCDWCDPLSTCPPTIGVTACSSTAQCQHTMLAATCDGTMFVYAEIQLADCQPLHTCIKLNPEQDCADAACQGWYRRDSYVNFGYLYTISHPCKWDGDTDLYACLPADPPVNFAQAWGMITAQSQLDEESARVVNIAVGTGDCEVIQCEECDECTADGYTVTNITAAEADEMPCGTFTQVGDNTVYDPCAATCWEADACEGECQTPDATECLPSPPDPCA